MANIKSVASPKSQSKEETTLVAFDRKKEITDKRRKFLVRESLYTMENFIHPCMVDAGLSKLDYSKGLRIGKNKKLFIPLFEEKNMGGRPVYQKWMQIAAKNWRPKDHQLAFVIMKAIFVTSIKNYEDYFNKCWNQKYGIVLTPAEMKKIALPEIFDKLPKSQFDHLLFLSEAKQVMLRIYALHISMLPDK